MSAGYLGGLLTDTDEDSYRLAGTSANLVECPQLSGKLLSSFSFCRHRPQHGETTAHYGHQTENCQHFAAPKQPVRPGGASALSASWNRARPIRFHFFVEQRQDPARLPEVLEPALASGLALADNPITDFFGGEVAPGIKSSHAGYRNLRRLILDRDFSAARHLNRDISWIQGHDRLAPAEHPLGIVRAGVHAAARGWLAVVVVPVG